MKTSVSQEEYAEMAAQAAKLEENCATAKPERLPRHELALFLMERTFCSRCVLIALALLVVFVVLELAFNLI